MFYNGFAEVEITGKSCFINTKGEKQFEPKFEEIRLHGEGFGWKF